ncbi:hypothetical protein [Janibacter sp. GXQ6167]|uniref:hypothetical protein n=1 Tax=Janibacter sp. GXQ6167 TaxID=3240791 RepID=UPI0035262569
MQYELRTQVIEPQRKTFDHLVKRYGDRPATRYEEGTVDVQAKENFHFRPLWDPSKEIYDEDFSAFKLTDPYSFLDPRQYYYAPYVTSRAGISDAFSTTLDYVEGRGLLGRLPAGWREVLAEVIVPTRHYESGAQLVSVDVARFGFGTSITQCAAYAGFDRIGNAQQLSRVGIALGEQTTAVLTNAKAIWVEDESMQGLRKFIEETITERDWGVSLVALDTMDQVLYGLLYGHLDEAAIDAGAGTYSLIAAHLSDWFKDQRRWLDALYKAWREDPEHGDANAALLAQTVNRTLDTAATALAPLVAAIDSHVDAKSGPALDIAIAALRPTTAS